MIACMARKRAQSETKLAKISMTIIFAFVLCWTPFIVTRAWSIYRGRLPSLVLIGAVLIVDLTSLINPVIYSSLRSDLRQSIRNVFRAPRTITRVQPARQATTTDM
ncbi:hypothetical protein QZH41_019684 [Actinostola sp. cb2023]|nr:hypothetical protein QZH41_019684 [Actinostola sp. cb2023]